MLGENLTDSKFGYITVVKRSGVDKNGTIIWDGYCDCNPQKILSLNGDNLKREKKNTLWLSAWQ